jgi:hypothetical protein
MAKNSKTIKDLIIKTAKKQYKFYKEKCILISSLQTKNKK